MGLPIWDLRELREPIRDRQPPPQLRYPIESWPTHSPPYRRQLFSRHVEQGTALEEITSRQPDRHDLIA